MFSASSNPEYGAYSAASYAASQRAPEFIGRETGPESRL